MTKNAVNARDGGSSPTVAHVETIPGSHQRGATRIRCWCPIGHDHTYSEWVEQFGRSHYEARR